jgi:hypothetical protein
MAADRAGEGRAQWLALSAQPPDGREVAVKGAAGAASHERSRCVADQGRGWHDSNQGEGASAVASCWRSGRGGQPLEERAHGRAGESEVGAQPSRKGELVGRVEGRSRS